MASQQSVVISQRFAKDLVKQIDELTKARGHSPHRQGPELKAENELLILRNELHNRVHNTNTEAEFCGSCGRVKIASETDNQDYTKTL